MQLSKTNSTIELHKTLKNLKDTIQYSTVEITIITTVEITITVIECR